MVSITLPTTLVVSYNWVSFIYLVILGLVSVFLKSVMWLLSNKLRLVGSYIAASIGVYRFRSIIENKQPRQKPHCGVIAANVLVYTIVVTATFIHFASTVMVNNTPSLIGVPDVSCLQDSLQNFGQICTSDTTVTFAVPCGIKIRDALAYMSDVGLSLTSGMALTSVDADLNICLNGKCTSSSYYFKRTSVLSLQMKDIACSLIHTPDLTNSGNYLSFCDRMDLYTSASSQTNSSTEILPVPVTETSMSVSGIYTLRGGLSSVYVAAGYTSGPLSAVLFSNIAAKRTQLSYPYSTTTYTFSSCRYWKDGDKNIVWYGQLSSSSTSQTFLMVVGLTSEGNTSSVFDERSGKGYIGFSCTMSLTTQTLNCTGPGNMKMTDTIQTSQQMSVYKVVVTGSARLSPLWQSTGSTANFIIPAPQNSWFLATPQPVALLSYCAYDSSSYASFSWAQVFSALIAVLFMGLTVICVLIRRPSASRLAGQVMSGSCDMDMTRGPDWRVFTKRYHFATPLNGYIHSDRVVEYIPPAKVHSDAENPHPAPDIPIDSTPKPAEKHC